MLENRTILPNIHFDKPNKRIPFDTWKIQVPISVLPWPAGRLGRVSVNSFGYGGTNAHAILDDAEEFLVASGLEDYHILPAEPAVSAADRQRTRLFVFSALDEAALRRTLTQHRHYLVSQGESRSEQEESVYLDRLVFTLSNRRSQFSWKAYVNASTIAELKEAGSLPGFKSFRSSNKTRLAFVFTGQGAQWAQMGVELLAYPAFRTSVTEADTYLRGVHGSSWSVLEELEKSPKESNIHLTKISQPLCTVLQVALVELLKSWNIEPAGMVGHSSGEIAAAFSYGALSREDAWMIAYWRGHVCSELSAEATHGRGAMMAAGLSRDAADEYIKGITRGKIVVACVNSPSSVTISGDETGIDELQEKLTTDAVFCRKLKVEIAYHSHHMKLVAESFLDRIKSIRPKQPAGVGIVKMASSVTGDTIAHANLGPEYWVRNFVSPVLFSDAVSALLKNTGRRRRHVRSVESAFDLLVEVGPHGALKGPLRQILQHHEFPSVGYHSVLVRGENAIKASVKVAGELYVQGLPVSISAVNNLQFKPRPLVDVPSYPWNHSLRYWSESRVSRNYRFRKYPRHDLLGAPVPDCTEQDPRWRNIIRVSEQPWVRDHVVHSNVLYPGSGTIAMVLEGVQQIADKDKTIESIKLKDVRLSKAIVIPDDLFGVEMVLQLRRQRGGPSSAWTSWWEFSVYSCQENGKLEENGSGSVSISYQSEMAGSWTLGKDLICEAVKREYINTKKLCTRRIESKDFYNATKSAGLKYGPLFQGLTEIFADQGRCWSVINVPDTRKSMPANVESSHLIHPTTLDVIFHSMFAALGDGSQSFQNAAVPIGFDSLTFVMDLPSGPNGQFSGFCKVNRDGPRDLVADIYMSDMAWDEPKIQITGIRCRELPASNSLDTSSGAAKAPFGTLVWKPDIDLVNEDSLPRYVAEVSSQLDYSSGEISDDYKFVSTGDESLGELETRISAVRMIDCTTLYINTHRL
jgi:acyl transferase domain-containing protein